MLNNVLNEQLSNIINYKISSNELNEIRIRKNKPIVLFLKGQPYYISEKGLTCNLDNAIYGNSEMIEDIIYKASDCSIYSINEQIKQGFIVLDSGIRIGLCGNFVLQDEKVKTITNWTSLNIRIPHQIKNVCLSAFDQIITANGINNTLIISPPGGGKTTFIRDLVYQMSERNYCFNVTIVDERGEIAGGDNGNIELGNFCDVISFCSKQQGFNQAIRTLNPTLIITDEIGSENDFESLIYAMNCGVKVIATIHASTLEELKRKEFFNKLPPTYFTRYVLLSKKDGPGTFEGVFNEKFNRVTSW